MTTKACPDCGAIWESGQNFVGVEYSYDSPAHYDGLSEIQCLLCRGRFNRWTGKRLKFGEVAYPPGRVAAQ